MNKIKVISIFGTRPEAIKMAPLVKELESRPEEIESLVCVTAQHREMLDQVLSIFNIKPDYDLNIMKSKQTLTDITVNALKGIESILQTENPDLILVHGDTTTTFSGALAAFYNKTTIGHVEAGLRTYDKYQPFPEEMNRKMATSLCDIHFSPTNTSKNNLLKENVSEDIIFVTGNTSIDCIRTTVKDNYTFENKILNTIDFENKKVITLTAHRRENLGKPLEDICSAVLQISKEIENVEIVYPVHSNPAVLNTVNKILGNNKNIHLIEPLNLLDMHNLLNKSFLVMTDSGGLQEEVPSMNKPVLVLRNVTERPEGLDAGTLELIGSDKEKIISSVKELFSNTKKYNNMAMAKNPFGDGYASKRIVDSILYYFGFIKERPVDYMNVK